MLEPAPDHEQKPDPEFLRFAVTQRIRAVRVCDLVIIALSALLMYISSKFIYLDFVAIVALWLGWIFLAVAIGLSLKSELSMAQLWHTDAESISRGKYAFNFGINKRAIIAFFIGMFLILLSLTAVGSALGNLMDSMKRSISSFH